MKAFAARINAKVNSTQTCDGGDVKVICREKHGHISWQTCVEVMCDGGDVKVICRVKNTAISVDKLVMKTCVMEAM